MLTNGELDVLDAWRIEDSVDDDCIVTLIAQAREANALRAQFAEVQRQLAEATGPHCTGCGSAIDPDWCWCGSASNEHGRGDGHNPVSMGCSCHQSSDRDWIRHASLLREQAWRDRAQLAEARQLLEAQAPVIAAATATYVGSSPAAMHEARRLAIADAVDSFLSAHHPPTNVPALISSMVIARVTTDEAGETTMEPVTVDGEVTK